MIYYIFENISKFIADHLFSLCNMAWWRWGCVSCLFCFNFLDSFFRMTFSLFPLFPHFFSWILDFFFCVIWKTLQLVNCSHVFIVVEFGLVCAALSGGSYQLPLPVALVSSICLHSPTWPFGAGNAFDISSDDCLKSPLMIWCVFYVCVECWGWGRLGGFKGPQQCPEICIVSKTLHSEMNGPKCPANAPTRTHLTSRQTKPNWTELNRTEQNRNQS